MRTKRPRRTYTREFKIEAVRLAKANPHPTKVATELGIPESTLCAWLSEFGSTFSPERDSTPIVGDKDAEIVRLRQELERVKLERDFLKKAAAFFAKNES